MGYYSHIYPHYLEDLMRTIQMTLDDNLVASVDRVVKKLKTTRSAFTRKALKDAIKQVNLNMLEKNIKQDTDVILLVKQNLVFGNQNKNGVINEAGRGEVRWYKFKSPDKKRPVVILTRITTLSKEKLFELHNAICFALNL